MYHCTFSSPLKTALDYSGFDEFADSTVGLLGVAGSAFPRAALDHLRTTMRALDAWTLPLDVAIPNSHEQVVNGVLVDDSLRDRTHRLGTAPVRNAGIAQYAEQTSAPVTRQIKYGNVGDPSSGTTHEKSAPCPVVQPLETGGTQ